MKYAFFACIATLMSCSKQAEAAVILSPTEVVQNTLGESGAIFLASAFDQSGLSVEFISGVTDFDTYIEASPTHRFAAELEWFAPNGVSSGNIDWDLGDVYSIDRIAIWNEDGTGVENLSVFTSNDPSFGSDTFVGDFTLSNNLVGAFYGADVLSVTPTDARYVRLQIQSAFPDDEGFLSKTASLGEIAFSVSTVPEPSLPWPLGVFLIGWLRTTMR